MKRGKRQRQRSQSLIAAAFSRLLQTKPYSEIQISEIIVAANVGRTTFYRHYSGKIDILVQIHGPIFKRLMQDFASPADWYADTASPRIVRFLKLAQDMKEFSVADFLGRDLSEITLRLNQLLVDAIRIQIKHVFTTQSPQISISFLSQVLSSLYVSQLIRWLIEPGIEESAESFAHALQCSVAAIMKMAYPQD